MAKKDRTPHMVILSLSMNHFPGLQVCEVPLHQEKSSGFITALVNATMISEGRGAHE